MSSDFEIGRIVAVDSAQITVELNSELKALTKSTYEQTVTIGQVNSYVTIPVGAQKIVAMVTRVMMTEEAELKTDKTMVALPSSRRIMKATMIGTIESGEFRQGISMFPVLDNPVHVPSRSDLTAIFACKSETGRKPKDGDPGYCIPIGKSVIFPDFDIMINPDVFFGKHTAILGSTGAGKSCTVATIIQSVLDQPEVLNTRFIILDTNGEYRTAFQKQDANGTWADAHVGCKSLYIPTDPGASADCLAIPYWFMNSDDFVRLFRAAPQVQTPVLLNALSCAREHTKGSGWLSVRNELILECGRLLSLSKTGTWQDRSAISTICDSVEKALTAPQNKAAVDELVANYEALSASPPVQVFADVKKTAGRKNGADYDPLGMAERQAVEARLESLLAVISVTPDSEAPLGSSSADCPRYFGKGAFRHRYLENALSRNDTSSGRTRADCATMLVRIHRLLEDRRFEFLFGPTGDEWPEVQHSLAAFLRDIFGLESAVGYEASSKDMPKEGQLPFYDRQRSSAERKNVVIVDLSLLAPEVLENVTALIGRLIHEFLQRLSDPASGSARGGFPTVLVLEEAQNYIREVRLEEEPISKRVFERIAREGRKFGLGLIIASQRPSELSKTVLSQCNSFIVHRLQNPEDLNYFRQIVPGIYAEMLAQLPALAQQTALVLGACVQAPALVRMRDVNPPPRSNDPRFYEYWTSADPKVPDVEAVCAKWEGRSQEPPGQPDGEEPGEDDRATLPVPITACDIPDFDSIFDPPEAEMPGTAEARPNDDYDGPPGPADEPEPTETPEWDTDDPFADE